MLSLVCVLFGFAWLIDRLGMRRFSRLLGALSLLLVLAVGCGPLPSWMLRDLQRTGASDFTDWGARNAIVLLGAGTVRSDRAGAPAEANVFAYGRIVEAARLYRACAATGNDCKIEISGGDARGLGLSEAVVYRRVLLGLGVEAGDLILEPASMTTWQNAQFSQPLLRAYRPQRIVLVSSATHLHRAELYFLHFGMRTTPVRLGLVARLVVAAAAELQLHPGRCGAARIPGHRALPCLRMAGLERGGHAARCAVIAARHCALSATAAAGRTNLSVSRTSP